MASPAPGAMPADSVAILAIASFPQRRDIRSALVRGSGTPAQTTVATFAAELSAVVVQDIADNLLPQSALSQLKVDDARGHIRSSR